MNNLHTDTVYITVSLVQSK